MFKLNIFSLIVVLGYVAAHGTVHDPVARQTRWRYDPTATANYDDVGVYCGGIGTQHQVNGGKCGFCGDNYADNQPRNHELGGKYGQGVIVKSYTRGNILPVKVQLSANHMGAFVFQLCNLDNNGGQESDFCFEQNQLKLTNGNDRYVLQESGPGWFDIDLQLPVDLACEHCVLRWTYTAANNWGTCENGGQAAGCGPQETFRACSDISVI